MPQDALAQRLVLLVTDWPHDTSTLHPDDAAALGLDTASPGIQLADGSDCIIPVHVRSTTMPGTLGLSRVQQYNLRIASGHRYAFRCVVLVWIACAHVYIETGRLRPLTTQATASPWLTWTSSCACSHPHHPTRCVYVCHIPSMLFHTIHVFT